MTGEDDHLRLDNPLLVRWEFASEERQQTRNAIYRRLIDGVNAEDVVFDLVQEFAPDRVLEVGCGAGELAEKLQTEVGAQVTAVDVSERMVSLTRSRGVDAQVADVLDLPFEDGSFDCVVLAWVLYHVHDRDRAIAECARVLRDGGRVVASTMADENLADLWEFLGASAERRLSFSSANGAEQLERHFTNVEAYDARSVVVFPSPDVMRAFVSADITRAHLSAAVPESFDEPVRARSRHTVFVGEKG